MKKHLWKIVALGVFGVTVSADDVIPTVAREEMSSYRQAFGKAIAESRRVERESRQRPNRDNFGGKVSEAARGMKDDISKDHKNFGGWVSSQKGQSQGGDGGAVNSAKSKRPRGRPANPKKKPRD